MHDEISTQVMLAVATPYLIQFLKSRTWFPFLTYETGKLNKAVSVLIAFLTGIGILVAYDKGAGVLTVSGLTLANLKLAAWHAGQQFMMQHAAYKTLVAPPLPGAVQDAQRRSGDAAPAPVIVVPVTGVPPPTILAPPTSSVPNFTPRTS